METLAPYAEYPTASGHLELALRALRVGIVLYCMPVSCSSSYELPPNGSSDLMISSDEEATIWIAKLYQFFGLSSDDNKLIEGLERYFESTMSEDDRFIPVHEIMAHFWPEVFRNDSDSAVLVNAECCSAFRSILSAQRGRYLFRLETGEMGFSPKRVLPGGRVYAVPLSRHFHVLSPDSRAYLSEASVLGLDAKLCETQITGDDPRWEIVYLQ